MNRALDSYKLYYEELPFRHSRNQKNTTKPSGKFIWPIKRVKKEVKK